VVVGRRARPFGFKRAWVGPRLLPNITTAWT